MNEHEIRDRAREDADTALALVIGMADHILTTKGMPEPARALARAVVELHKHCTGGKIPARWKVATNGRIYR